MANVNTFDLTIYLGAKDLVFRGISRIAKKRYLKHYENAPNYLGYHSTERKVK